MCKDTSFYLYTPKDFGRNVETSDEDDVGKRLLDDVNHTSPCLDMAQSPLLLCHVVLP